MPKDVYLRELFRLSGFPAVNRCPEREVMLARIGRGNAQYTHLVYGAPTNTDVDLVYWAGTNYQVE
jgi:hypothetical protein